MIRVMLVDDHALFREGLGRIISLEEDICIVGECGDGTEVVEAAQRLSPDIVIMDINMPHMNGVEAATLLHEREPNMKIIFLSIHDDENYVFQTLRNGAAGYLLKDMEAAHLIEAIRSVYIGHRYIHPHVTGKLVDELRRLSNYEVNLKRNTMLREVHLEEVYGKRSSDWHSVITEREYEVLKLMSMGMSNRSIGEHLYISEKTVKNHVSNMLFKLKVQDRTQAVVLGIKYGWIEA